MRTAAFSLGVAAMVLATPAVAAPYISLQGGGLQFWTACDNEEIEGRCGWPFTGWTAGLAAGDRVQLDERWGVRYQAELSYNRHDIHGLRGECGSSNDCSADDLSGNNLEVLSLTANAMPDYQLSEHVRVFGGVGLGPALVRGLNDETMMFVAQGRLGLSFTIPSAPGLTIDLYGNVMHGLGDPTLTGRKLEYTSAGPALRLSCTLEHLCGLW